MAKPQQPVTCHPSRPNLQHHQSFNKPAVSSIPQGQPRFQGPKQTPSHGAQLLSTHIPQICISLEPGVPLDPGLKKEISQQVREFKAHKDGQRGRSPGLVKEHNKAVGQVPNKGPKQRQNEGSSQGLGPNRSPSGPGNQKEKPRSRPVSDPNHAVIMGMKSSDQQLKAAQAHPRSPGLVQKSGLGSNPVFSPLVKLVSGQIRSKSPSPCRRIDVDIEPATQGRSQTKLKQAVSDDLDLPKQKNPYSPASKNGNCLNIPNINLFLSPPSDGHKSGERMGQNAIKGSSSMCDLSASAPADLLRQNLPNVSRIARSAEHLAVNSPASKSTSENCLYIDIPRRRSSCSPASTNGNYLHIPNNNLFLSPPSDGHKSGERMGQNAMNGGSSSMCDLSASAPADLLRQTLANVNQGHRSSEHLVVDSPVSKSSSENVHYIYIPRQRNSYSPASTNGNRLHVPDFNQMLSPPPDSHKSGEIMGQNPIKGSSSMCDLSASAPADLLRPNFANVNQACRSSEHLAVNSPPNPVHLLYFLPTTAQNVRSCSPTSSKSESSSTVSPLFSPDHMADQSSPTFYATLVLPNQTSVPVLISPNATPHGSPNGSPFGSQTMVNMTTVGAES